MIGMKEGRECMNRLVVSDFDGTLKAFSEERVLPEVKRRIDALLDKGVAFAVSSGRTYGELAAFLPEYVDRIYFICNDGACYLKNGKLLYEKQIERTELIPFFSCKDGVSRIFHGAYQNYTVGDRLPPYGEAFAPISVKNVYEIREKIFKITSFGEPVRLCESSGLRIHWDGGPMQAAQMVNRFVSKGTALSDLQVRLMLTRFDTACIGDAGNDVAMMKGAKYSFCVGNRSEELAKACERRVESVIEALDTCLDLF